MSTSSVVVDRGRASLQALFTEMWLVTATVTPAAVAAEATGSDTITVSGVRPGDIVIEYSTDQAISDNLIIQVSVSANDTVKIQYTNNNVAAGAAITHGTGTFTVLIGRPRTSKNSV